MQPTNNNATAELLDKGQFIITYFPNGIEKKIKGRFTMVAFDRFCTEKNISSYFDLLKKISIGMSIGDYADLLLCAFQDYYRNNPTQCELTRENVLDVIDELGGVGEKFLNIILHCVGRINGGSEPEKKSQPQPQPHPSFGHLPLKGKGRKKKK